MAPKGDIARRTMSVCTQQCMAMFLERILELVSKKSTKLVQILVLWANYGLSGGTDGTGRVGKWKAAVVLVLLAKECG